MAYKRNYSIFYLYRCGHTRYAIFLFPNATNTTFLQQYWVRRYLNEELRFDKRIKTIAIRLNRQRKRDPIDHPLRWGVLVRGCATKNRAWSSRLTNEPIADGCWSLVFIWSLDPPLTLLYIYHSQFDTSVLLWKRYVRNFIVKNYLRRSY